MVPLQLFTFESGRAFALVGVRFHDAGGTFADARVRGTMVCQIASRSVITEGKQREKVHVYFLHSSQVLCEQIVHKVFGTRTPRKNNLHVSHGILHKPSAGRMSNSARLLPSK